MERFPEIKSTQVVIMRADSLTGYILDVDFQLAVNDTQKVYTIVDSVDEAMAIINAERLKKTSMEFVIYDADKKVLKYIK